MTYVALKIHSFHGEEFPQISQIINHYLEQTSSI